MDLQLIAGILILISYLGFIVYAAKGGNMMLGMFIMAVLWAIFGAIGGTVTWSTVNNTVFNDGPLGFGSTAVQVIFGSWFGRILIQTGIAGKIIRKSVELGGDKPGITCILLCLVTAAIFTTSYGPGAVVAIGVIVFPIMLSLGIPKALAAASYCMSVSCGLYFNQSILAQAAGVITLADGARYDFQNPQWLSFAGVAVAIHMVAIVLMVLFFNRKEGKVHAWAAPDTAAIMDKNVHGLALLTPIIPVTLSIAFKINQIPAILIAVIWALVFTGNMKGFKNVCDTVQKTFHDGVSDVGLVLGFILFLMMFNKAASACAPLLAPIIAPILPQSYMWIFIVFGLLGFLALYRGPLSIWGAGTATVVIVANATGMPLSLLFPLFFIPCVAVATNVCPTQSWNLWSIGYVKASVKDFMRMSLPFALPCMLVLMIVGYFMLA